MIVDYTKVKHIYLVCGKTDMRKSIEAWLLLFRINLIWRYSMIASSYSVEVAGINTKHSIGMETGLYCCTSV